MMFHVFDVIGVKQPDALVFVPILFLTGQVEFRDGQRLGRDRLVGEEGKEASAHRQGHGPLTQLQQPEGTQGHTKTKWIKNTSPTLQD